ncbi:DNA integrity scanning protein DisA nucleotide-binding domain protein [Vulgatibacter sp.]|uniref:DNA integrity scanning protein DisA nucleotide-binding domain protein n=1 Tax=Vulgatibacter sp. TaxID=1971226 RepID=UPI0035652D85
MAEPTSKLDREFLRSALTLAARPEIDHLLLISDYPLASEELKGRSLRRKLIYAVTTDNLARDLREDGFRAVVIPGYDYSRMEKTKVALVAAASTFGEGEMVLCVTGHRRSLDTMVKLQVGAEVDDSLSVEALRLPPEFNPQVVEQVLGLALAIGQEGFEGHPVGTIVVLGDSIGVLEKSKQLTINPFQGISEGERNILDPKIKEAVKNFSVLDGAFVIREDGVVLAAGRYLQSGGSDELKIPLGLGARHAAAALMTATTKAIALVVSQTSGTVRIFRGGEIIFELHQSKRRI